MAQKQAAGMVVVILKIVTTAAFVIAGGSALIGIAGTVELFDRIGLGQGFRYVTGGLEVLGAAGLFIPGAAFYAATLLAGMMIAAIALHRAVIGGSGVPATILLLLTTAIAWLSRAGQRR